jgi:hypothetical protein
MIFLAVNLSAEKGLRIDLSEVALGPDGFIRIEGLLVQIVDGAEWYESGPLLVTSAGAQSPFLAFTDFVGDGTLDLSNIRAIRVGMYAAPGTDFVIDRIIATRVRDERVISDDRAVVRDVDRGADRLRAERAAADDLDAACGGVPERLASPRSSVRWHGDSARATATRRTHMASRW